MSLSDLTKVSEEGVTLRQPPRRVAAHAVARSGRSRSSGCSAATSSWRSTNWSRPTSRRPRSSASAMERSMRWARRSRDEFDRGGEHAERAALFGIQQGVLDEALRQDIGRGADRHRLRRLCGRRAGGGRGAGGDVRLPRLRARPTARRQAALSDGGRQARRHRRGGAARDRHVRLRAADALGADRPGVHRRRADQPPQRANSPRTRSRSSRAARARPARRSAAPMSTTSSGRARSSARC